MFTGIIQNKAKVFKREEKEKGLFLDFLFPTKMKLKKGESVAINGICSTVSDLKKGKFSIFYMPETLKKTTAGRWRVGEVLNLEESLKFGKKLNGYLTSGHIEGVRKVLKVVDNKKEGYKIEFEFKKEDKKYLYEKGNVVINGVALTVSKMKKTSFEVSLIPYTLKHTTLKTLKKDSLVNIEFDLITKIIVNTKK